MLTGIFGFVRGVGRSGWGPGDGRARWFLHSIGWHLELNILLDYKKSP